jgi:hypothetical protein
MSLVHLLIQAARRVAVRVVSDPQTRAKAQQVFDEDVRPKAEQAWREAKPKVDSAVSGLRARLKETALPAHDLKGFARKVKEEFQKGRKGE